MIFFLTILQFLDRVFNILLENNPNLAGDRRRTILSPPFVFREGIKKTVFANFMYLCKKYAFFYLHIMSLPSNIADKSFNGVCFILATDGLQF